MLQLWLNYETKSSLSCAFCWYLPMFVTHFGRQGREFYG